MLSCVRAGLAAPVQPLRCVPWSRHALLWRGYAAGQSTTTRAALCVELGKPLVIQEQEIKAVGPNDVSMKVCN